MNTACHYVLSLDAVWGSKVRGAEFQERKDAPTRMRPRIRGTLPGVPEMQGYLTQSPVWVGAQLFAFVYRYLAHR